MKQLLNFQDFKGGREATLDEYNQIRLLLDLDLLKRDTYTVGFKGWLVADTYHGGRSKELNLTINQLN